jgi:molybdate transport system regulatory protein
MNIKPGFKLWLEVDGKPILGDGRAELLSEIDKCGSLSKAARNLDISYRHAHSLVENLNERCGRTILESSIGGSDGGGMRITDFGMELVNEFANIKKEITKCLSEHNENRKL